VQELKCKWEFKIFEKELGQYFKLAGGARSPSTQARSTCGSPGDLAAARARAPARRPRPARRGYAPGVWQAALGPEVDVAPLAAKYAVGPGPIFDTVAQVRGRTDLPSLEAALRQRRGHRLATLAQPVTWLASWSELVLPAEVRDSLREFVGRARHRRRVFEDWGLGRLMTTSRGLTALLQGAPGTGKTMTAGVIARELGADLYRVDLSRILSKWLGETERNLGAIFDAAEDGQTILLFDEADSLFAKRTEVRTSNDRHANAQVNYLLQRLDAFEGIAILTTNLDLSLDEAFKRWLSLRLALPFPDREQRIDLWRAHLLPELPLAGTSDLEALADRYALSGGYIRNAVQRAAFLAAEEDTHVGQEHLERAVVLEYRDVGRIAEGGVLA
jgi:hypothetical protein